MSSYQFKARNKKTGEVVGVNALDDYLGLHQYGYMINGDLEVLPEKVFDSKYEVVKINTTEEETQKEVIRLQKESEEIWDKLRKVIPEGHRHLISEFVEIQLELETYCNE